MPSRFDVTRDELAALLAGEPRYRVDQVWRGWYEQLAATDELTNLPKGLRTTLGDLLPSALVPVAERVSDGGDTVKQVWQIDGGHLVESVLMYSRDRVTVCVSSQAGCAMGAASAPPARPASHGT
jgi:23S rRNA (adenine2503-C2)-methyltransferase